jgi:Tfp pilus assembly protein PilO
MKTNTVIIFILSFLFLGSTVVLALYMRKEIGQKIEVVQGHHLKEKENKNFEFGNQLKINGELLKTQEQTLKNVFLDAAEIVGFITNLESTGKTLGLDIVVEKVDYGTPESVESTYTVQPVSFNVQIDGPYAQIKTFLDTIKQSKKILTTKEIKLYKSGSLATQYTARVIIEGTILKQ